MHYFRLLDYQGASAYSRSEELYATLGFPFPWWVLLLSGNGERPRRVLTQLIVLILLTHQHREVTRDRGLLQRQ